MRSIHTAAAATPRTTSRSTWLDSLKFAALEYTTSWFPTQFGAIVERASLPRRDYDRRFYADLVAAHPRDAASQAPRPRHFHHVSAAYVMKLGPLVSDPTHKNPRGCRGSRSGASRTRTGGLLGAIQGAHRLNVPVLQGKL